MNNTERRPVKRGDIYHMLGHIMRVTTVKKTNCIGNENRVFLTCCPDCCTPPFHVKLQMLENDLREVTLDKL